MAKKILKNFFIGVMMLFIGIILAFSILKLAKNNFFSEEKPENFSEKENNNDLNKEIEDSKDIYENVEKLEYKKIIKEYADAINDANLNFDNAYKYTQKYPNVNMLAIINTKNYKNTKIEYAFYDINHNGTYELLIRQNNKEGYVINTPVDIYTYDGAKVIKLFVNNESEHWDSLAERSRLTVYSDGTMYIYSSVGASSGVAEFYQIDKNDFSRVLKEKYNYDANLYPNTPYYNKSEFLTENLFKDKFKNLYEVTDFNWAIIQ